MKSALNKRSGSVAEAPGRLPIREWPVTERPRERLLAQGPERLSEAELLALLLRTGSGPSSALDLARAVMGRAMDAGGWDRLNAAGLQRIKGLGPAKAAVVLAGLELGRRAALAPQDRRGELLRGSRQAWQLCRAEMEPAEQERFVVLCMDVRHRVLGRRTITVGTLTQSLVHPREVFRPALELGAAAVLVLHNHPSGDPDPSQEDHAVTQRLLECARLLGLKLVDHLVIGRGAYFSYADHAWKVDGIRLGE
jgi:DNA repair protein RadC